MCDTSITIAIDIPHQAMQHAAHPQSVQTNKYTRSFEWERAKTIITNQVTENYVATEQIANQWTTDDRQQQHQQKSTVRCTKSVQFMHAPNNNKRYGAHKNDLKSRYYLSLKCMKRKEEKNRMQNKKSTSDKKRCMVKSGTAI